MTVRALSREGKPLPGYPFEKCKKLMADSVELGVE
jgi:hypothetical protein